MKLKNQMFKIVTRGLLALCIFLGTWSWNLLQIHPGRTVSLKIVTDEEFEAGSLELEALFSEIATVSERFAERFGIRFEVKETGTWRSDDSRQMMFELLDDMRRQTDKSGCDVVLGMTGQDYQNMDYLGAASYLNGYLLLQSSVFERDGRGILEHEIAHLFGAVDLNEPRSIMNSREI